jgi:anti-sigma factor RsiW
MKNEFFHPSDQQLLLFTDGELPAHRADQVRAHLRACGDCRTRMAEMESTIADFMQVHRQTLDPQVPPIEGPRAQLEARLAELARSAHQNQRSSLLSVLPVRRLAYLCALTILVVFGAWMLQRQATENQLTAPENAGMLPNPSLTPGATATTATSSICSMSDDEVVAPVSGSLRQRVFKEYGIVGAPTANYEIDYLITPGLGGSGDIRNLWPEPRYDTAWNSFVKDQLEEYLHRAVCGGRVSLPVAQHEIANNWIAAYKRYFHTDRPLSAHLASRVSMISDPSTSDRGCAAAGDWFSPPSVLLTLETSTPLDFISIFS